MLEPFMHNHQYNVLREQVDILLYNVSHLVDLDVKEAVRHNAADRILLAFPSLSQEQSDFLNRIRTIHEDEIGAYLDEAASYVIPFPEITNEDIKKVLPKSKKVKAPYYQPNALTYLGWNDVRSNKKYIIYPYNGELIGVEASYSIVSQRTTCFVCKRYGEVAHVWAVFNDSGAHHTIGNYMCVDSRLCNDNVTDPAPLEEFLKKFITIG